MSGRTVRSVPGAGRGPRAGSPRGVVDATGASTLRMVEIATARPGRYRSRY